MGSAKNEWHDLRKNPQDLPKEPGAYLTEHGGMNPTVLRYNDGWNVAKFSDGSEYRDAEIFDVIAWAEYEPFEG